MPAAGEAFGDGGDVHRAADSARHLLIDRAVQDPQR
jgi:hypothetical protein